MMIQLEVGDSNQEIRETLVFPVSDDKSSAECYVIILKIQ
jgi:hypothetical protein